VAGSKILWLFWKGRKLDKVIENNREWPKISILMAFLARENASIDPVIKAVKSIYNDGYPPDKIQLIIIVNGENPPNPPGGRDIVEEERKKIEDALRRDNLDCVFNLIS